MDSDGKIINSIEENDCTNQQKNIKLVNVGIYLIHNSLIIQNIDELKNNNSQREYYLPDLLLILIRKEYPVLPIILENEKELININTKDDLGKANNVRYF